MKSNFVKIATTAMLFAAVTFTACQKNASIEPSTHVAIGTDMHLNEPNPNGGGGVYRNCLGAALSQSSTGNSQVYNYDPMSKALSFAFNVVDPAMVGGAPVRRMVGLACDRSINTYYGVTNITCPDAPHRNKVLTINATGQVTANFLLRLSSTMAVVNDLSDIERNEADGLYYAIRGFNHVVRVDVLTGLVYELSATPTVFPGSIKGLATANNRIYVLESTSATNGRAHEIDKANGNMILSQAMSPITNGMGAADFGLFYNNCSLVHELQTANRFGDAVFFSNVNWATPMVTAQVPIGPNIPVFDFTLK